MPSTKGSSGSKYKVDWPQTKARPVMLGITSPSSPRLYCALNRLPMMLSCTRPRPAASCRPPRGRRAWRWCPCRRASGRTPRRGRGRNSAPCASRGAGGPKNSIWSISARAAGNALRREPILDGRGRAAQRRNVSCLQRAGHVSAREKTNCRPRRRRRVTSPSPGTSTLMPSCRR